MKNVELQQIVFYGFDFTSLDEAFVEMPFGDGNVRFESLKNNGYLKNILWEFLQDINKEKENLNIGYSDHLEKKEKKPDDFNLVNYSNVSKDGADRRQFGSLVGTVRKIYCKGDTKTNLIQFINNINIEEHQNYPLIKQLSSVSRASRKVSIKVEILSRFDKFEKKQIELLRPYFLAAMLLKGKIRFSSNMNVDFNYDSIFDFYMLWVLMSRFNEALHKGFFKKYQRFEGNDDRMKGSIDIARHIKLNMESDNGKIAYSYRENSLDNYLNHLILAALDHLENKYPALVAENINSELERIIKQLKYEIGYPKYDLRTIIAKNVQPISHPYFSEYKELQRDCLKILRDEGISPFGNTDEHVDGVLYYVPDLWEEYLENHIRRAIRFNNLNNGNREGIEFVLFSQYPVFTMTDLEGKGGHVTFPDYCFSFRDNNGKEEKIEYNTFFMLDAKYRPLWKNSLLGVLEKGLMDDYNKCIRDMVSIGAISSGVIFPVSSRDEIELLESSVIHRFSKINSFNYFYTFPVVVPEPADAEKFYEWEKRMSNSISNSIKIIMPMLEFEMERYTEVKSFRKRMERNNKVGDLAVTITDLWFEEED